jgi:hypothetical protein
MGHRADGVGCVPPSRGGQVAGPPLLSSRGCDNPRPIESRFNIRGRGRPHWRKYAPFDHLLQLSFSRRDSRHDFRGHLSCIIITSPGRGTCQQDYERLRVSRSKEFDDDSSDWRSDYATRPHACRILRMPREPALPRIVLHDREIGLSR